MAQRKEILVSFPGGDFKERIQSNDEKEFCLPNPLSKMRYGIDRVGLPFSQQLHIRDGKGRVVVSRQTNHLEAIGGRDLDPLILVRRQSRRNEVDLLEVEHFAGCLHPPQMSEMNGVKRPAD